MFLGQFRSENTGKIPKKIFGHYFPHKKGDIPQKSFFKGFLARKSQFQGGNSDQIIVFTFFSYSTVNLEPRMMVGKFRKISPEFWGITLIPVLKRDQFSQLCDFLFPKVKEVGTWNFYTTYILPRSTCVPNFRPINVFWPPQKPKK